MFSSLQKLTKLFTLKQKKYPSFLLLLLFYFIFAATATQAKTTQSWPVGLDHSSPVCNPSTQPSQPARQLVHTQVHARFGRTWWLFLLSSSLLPCSLFRHHHELWLVDTIPTVYNFDDGYT